MKRPQADPETEWVTVFDALGMEIAHIIKTRLESEDLPVALRFETMATFGLSAGFGVQVQVPRALEDRAREILDAEPESAAMDGEDPDADDPDAPAQAAGRFEGETDGETGGETEGDSEDEVDEGRGERS